MLNNVKWSRQVWTFMLHILFYCSEYNTFHITEIYFNTIQNRGRKHCAPILTGLRVLKLYVHDITKTFTECNSNRLSLHLCLQYGKIWHFLHGNQSFELVGASDFTGAMWSKFKIYCNIDKIAKTWFLSKLHYLFISSIC